VVGGNGVQNESDGHLLALAARLEREMGHSAVAGAMEVAADRAFGRER
jgi:hypothetical protein